MTVLQQQCLLAYLGYSPGVIDGKPGSNTSAAIRRFQQDYPDVLAVDGIAGALTEKLLIGVVAGTVAKKEPEAPQPEAAPDDSGILPGALKYLCEDGYFRIPKGANVQLTKNFSSGELDCQGVGCCDTTVILKAGLLLWQEIRDDIGEPLPIGDAGGSGYRCPVHNADPSVGGAAGSLHLTGAAADLHHRDPAKLESVALRHCKDGEVGRYSWGCHVGSWQRGYVNRFVGNS